MLPEEDVKIIRNTQAFTVAVGGNSCDLSKYFRPNERVKITTSLGEYSVQPVTYKIEKDERYVVDGGYIDREFNREFVIEQIREFIEMNYRNGLKDGLKNKEVFE